MLYCPFDLEPRVRIRALININFGNYENIFQAAAFFLSLTETQSLPQDRGITSKLTNSPPLPL